MVCIKGEKQKDIFMTTGLIADIGATNARFALVDEERGIHSAHTLPCANYETIVAAVHAYRDMVSIDEPVRHAAFSIAGPVQGDYFSMTNLPWSFSIEETRQALGLDEFALINDFEAQARAIPLLSPDHYRQIGAGTPQPESPIGITGPGTGLGVASLFWDGQGYSPVPGEGGHATMPARTQREFDIFHALREKYRHVSAERVCSGKGLANIYNTIRLIDDHKDLPDRDPAAISAAALDQSCPVCVESLDLMMGFLGTISGNLALTIGAQGGIYIAGGIAQQLGDYIDGSRFRSEFERKGRFEDYLKAIPTYVITHDTPAFLGLYDLLRRKSLSSL